MIRVISGVLFGLSLAGTAIAETPTGWQRRNFVFGSAADFSTMLPPGTEPKTIPLAPRSDGTAVRRLIVGKVPPSDRFAAEMTVSIFDFTAPASPVRLCERTVTGEGGSILWRNTAEDLSAARIVALYPAESEIAMTECNLRGREVLVIHLSHPATDDPSAAGDALMTLAEGVLGNLTFLANLPSVTTDLPLTAQGRTVALPLDEAWAVPINDFDGTVPAELNLVRKDGDASSALVWILLAHSDAPPDDRKAADLIATYIRAQSTDFGEPELLDIAPRDVPQGWSRDYRFHVAVTGADEPATLLGRVTTRDGQVAATALWLRPVMGSDERQFWADLPALTTYDLANRAADLLIAPDQGKDRP